jgi:glycosyltransferase involved in cell wall biosynthesis
MYGPTGDCSFVRSMGAQKKLFAEHGIDLRVITPDLFSSHSENILIGKPTWKHTLFVFLKQFSVLATRLFIYLRYQKRCDKLLRYYANLEDKGEVVAFQEMMACERFLNLYPKHKQKVLLTLHSDGSFWDMWYHKFPRLKSCLLDAFKKDVEKTLLQNVDMFGFVADIPRKRFCKLYGEKDNKTFFVYNGIPTKPLPKRVMADELSLVCVGTLCDRKNQMGILNAVAMMDEDHQKKISITFVGDGDIREQLEAKALTLNSEVRFTGSTKDVEKYLLQANLFCLFSKSEGLPISIVEAMRVGLPIVGSNVAGIPEQIIDGKTGYVVEIDEKELFERLRYIVEHKELLPQMGKDSYELFQKNFTIEVMVSKYANVYKAVISN